MSFTNTDIRFTTRRYSFEGPDFGSGAPVRSDTRRRRDGLDEACDTCGSLEEAPCVACADLALVASASIAFTVLDSLEDRVEGDPDLDEDPDDEEEDDDTESEKAWLSTPGIRF